MRTFKCYDCEHTWELPFGAGGRGVELTCPQCGSTNVHRESKPCGQGFRMAERFAGRGRGWRGRWNRGWPWG